MKPSENSVIKIRGARVHNLKNLDIDLPLHQLVCFSGPSGSGKSSLAFHTLLTESKRRFVNSFPNSVKFFIERPAPVDVDSINPVLPVFGLPQINPILTSRSQVCDVMQLSEDLQNLFFLHAKPYCLKHDVELKTIPIKEQIEFLFHEQNSCEEVFHVLIDRSSYQKIYESQFLPSRSYNFESKTLNQFNSDDELWELFRFKTSRLNSIHKKLLEIPYDLEKLDFYFLNKTTSKLQKFNVHTDKTCSQCDFQSPVGLRQSHFSPYSALGACKKCKGYGANLIYDDNKMILKELSIAQGGIPFLDYAPFSYAKSSLLKILKRKKISSNVLIAQLDKDFFDLLKNGEGAYPGFFELQDYLEIKKYRPSVRLMIKKFQKEVPCKACLSSRITSDVSHFKITFENKLMSIQQMAHLTIDEAYLLFEKYLKTHHSALETKKNVRTDELISDIKEKLDTARGLGLGHLSLFRKTKSLSAGEYQRLLLIKYLSFRGSDSLFVFDEPSLGLNPEEILKLIKGLRNLIEQGNSVIVVDHSMLMQMNCDQLIIMGPGSGAQGGEVVFQGVPIKYFNSQSAVIWPTKHLSKNSRYPQYLKIQSPQIYGHQYSNVKIPINDLTWVKGPSGSGKTSLIIKVLANELSMRLLGVRLSDTPYKIKSFSAPYDFDEIILFSSELNRFTSRSTVGTLTELATIVRKHFLKLPISKSMGLKDGHLSSNSELGMCSTCQGKGVLTIEMQYLEDVILECEDCKGSKIKPLYADISDGSMTVSQAYQMPLSELLKKIDLTPKFRRIWEYLKILNLDYLSLDRPLNSLSGGERQRIYLLSKLLKSLQNSLLIFENLSFGLSQGELIRVGELLKDLVQMKNTIIVIDACEDFRNLTNWTLELDKSSINLVPS